jgi:branched-chain amino acid transport system ATP-binding protein
MSGGFARRPSGRELRGDLERVYDIFPRLKARRHGRAGLLSGGEQQMAAIGRGLMSRPKLMLLDEPSMGLAPMIVEEIFEIIQRLNGDEGVSFLLAEQNAHLVLRYAHHGVVLENGRVVASGQAAELAARDDVSDFYLGARPARLLRDPRQQSNDAPSQSLRNCDLSRRSWWASPPVAARYFRRWVVCSLFWLRSRVDR